MAAAAAHAGKRTASFVLASALPPLSFSTKHLPRPPPAPLLSWNTTGDRQKQKTPRFCQSVDHLQEAVADTVASRGGEVLLRERRLKGGLHEALALTVCIPFLWGVPPEVDALR